MNYKAYAKQITRLNPATNVFVAFLDILGFSSFVVKQNTHSDVVKTYQSVFRCTIDMTLAETDIGQEVWNKIKRK